MKGVYKTREMVKFGPSGRICIVGPPVAMVLCGDSCSSLLTEINGERFNIILVMSSPLQEEVAFDAVQLSHVTFTNMQQRLFHFKKDKTKKN